FTARVVVGKPFHRTPVFSDMMEYIVINPYWNVPPSIANKEFLPKLRRDPGALARMNIRIIAASGEVNPYSVNWNAMSRIPYRLRQDTGGRNALGRLKFIFPNPYNVYIHDTPSKSLFKRSSRYFSHGCMRVQNPVSLAAVLLGPQGWNAARIKARITGGKRQIVRLKKKIPVHVTYLTAWVNKDGTVNFRKDIYGRDRRLAKALLGAAI
ncbi:MAG TPA: peptidoglycan-binding protein, partial [Rhizobiales bacterium]|nr:peptidoglycan-binding protein [Hyphomicrobiales bacterium]